MRICLEYEGSYKICRYDPAFKSYTVLNVDQWKEDVESAYFLLGHKNNLFIISCSSYTKLDKFGNICQKCNVIHDD